jgi:hypothetical protein
MRLRTRGTRRNAERVGGAIEAEPVTGILADTTVGSDDAHKTSGRGQLCFCATHQRGRTDVPLTIELAGDSTESDTEHIVEAEPEVRANNGHLRNLAMTDKGDIRGNTVHNRCVCGRRCRRSRRRSRRGLRCWGVRRRG